MEINQEIFQKHKYPRFGNDNPQKVDNLFWEFMVKTGHSAWWAREQFGCTNRLREGPIWTFERFGMSRTDLPDGRVIHVAGEHEDYYDPDFCIYNDAIALHPNGEISIYCYPENVFPSTDFHSATLVGNSIYMIGNLGYPDARKPGETPVYLLDCESFEIKQIETTGEKPGWIYKHEAEFIVDSNCIQIQGGEIYKIKGSEPVSKSNTEIYRLNILNQQWYCN
jgi:hypothetical protein